MIVQPVPTDPDCGMIAPLVANLIACDHCGIVAVDTPRFGWQRWTDPDGTVRHHCPVAAEYNEWVRNSLVHNVAPESAIEYDQWDDHPTDEQPELALPNAEHEAVTVAREAASVIEKSAHEATEAQFLGYADPPTEMPTAATDADFNPPTPVELRGPILHAENPIFPPVNKIELEDDDVPDA